MIKPMSRRKLFAAVGAVVFLLSSVAVVKMSSAASGTVEFDQPASAATYVSWNSRSTNYDGSPMVRASLTSYRTLLQFDTAHSRRLHRPVGHPDHRCRQPQQPVPTWPTTWGPFDPTTVTWNTRPALSGGPLGTTRDRPSGPGAQTIALDRARRRCASPTWPSPSATRGPSPRCSGSPRNAPVLDVVYTPRATTTTDTESTTTTSGPELHDRAQHDSHQHHGHHPDPPPPRHRRPPRPRPPSRPAPAATRSW